MVKLMGRHFIISTKNLTSSQNESVYAKSIAIKVCNDIVTMHEAMIELEKARKVLDPIRDSIQKDAADRVESMKKK